TYQTLALVGLIIVFWLGLFEALALLQPAVGQMDWHLVASACSPLRAILAASAPSVINTWASEVVLYLIVMGGITLLLNGLAISQVR
ncbi:MAG: hypothetical protein GTO62_06175, partial [Planctomycetales bacterium]|nr:hypothetical protein [Planctomycetales bacterium]NIP68515.1 hypothetical protein [Planctomycetales bacterium]